MNCIVGSQGKPLGQLASILKHVFGQFHLLDRLIPVVFQAALVVRQFCGRDPSKVNHPGKTHGCLGKAKAADQENIRTTPSFSQSTNPRAPILLHEKFDQSRSIHVERIFGPTDHHLIPPDPSG